ncbi:AraC family transcriptional regulator [Alishewanella longhuensis]|uniref:AraC family transcriptional regulator n=1 Tax=Alishewanella longhuensis TaxID=1091037 RepID=A0ABQ3L1T1_9ALTE|nr:DJ-1/PfpI family protein [Alishewanella longhuensis]GHG75057.1 AraC family transcriptional regulator [Alishewanella longhuensis]
MFPLRATHRVAMLIYPDAQILDIAGPLEVFSRTSRWLQQQGHYQGQAYSIELVAEKCGLVTTSGGISVFANVDCTTDIRCDTALVAGGIGFVDAMQRPLILDWLKQQYQQCQRIGSICTGALVLAAAGLLNGKSATTHWEYLKLLARNTTNCQIETNVLYVQSGNTFTSAGVTAGIDMALSMVESDWGKSVATAVAEQLLLERRRRATQPQKSRYLEVEKRTDRFGELQIWILEHLSRNLTVNVLAQRMAMSPRHFARQFKKYTGMTSADYVAQARLDEAKRLMAGGLTRLKDVAREAGFSSEQQLRRALQRVD